MGQIQDLATTYPFLESELVPFSLIRFHSHTAHLGTAEGDFYGILLGPTRCTCRRGLVGQAMEETQSFPCAEMLTILQLERGSRSSSIAEQVQGRSCLAIQITKACWYELRSSHGS